ncbi:hypothetical protein V6N13_106660 [Hibiscus sabdariffa]
MAPDIPPPAVIATSTVTVAPTKCQPLWPCPVNHLSRIYHCFLYQCRIIVTPVVSIPEGATTVWKANSPCLPHQVASTPVNSPVLPSNMGLSDVCPAYCCLGHSLQHQPTPILHSSRDQQQQPCSVQQGVSQPARPESCVAPCEAAGNSSFVLPTEVPAVVPNVAIRFPTVSNDNRHTMVTRSKASIF